MFDKLLIANRGEIACRIIGTARRLGIATAAVYSDADAAARHVRLADEAVAIGPSPARKSYLVIESIIAAARRCGAQAIHPGYGFLSENADFAEACAEAGIVFIGPPAEAIRAMGSKSAAKSLMEAAGVPLTLGYHGAEQDAAFLGERAAEIGYPVLIKACAGGGGRGMRRVERPEDFEAALASCRREAASSFGDDRVLIEKYVIRPRHIEIQVFGDTHGHCLHLFERDCSIQRRYQKVLEEAPAPGMSTERRAAMGAAAVSAARAVGYVGAGTVELIVARDGAFYFMEMNTRLQVEHPVTEMITGCDLVEWQLRVAAGEPLPLAQEDLSIDGHAIEARIYAEDPSKGFRPSPGTLLHLVQPEEGRHVRVDTGVEEGDEITAFYDPMIAKLIVWDVDRERARGRLRQALAGYRVTGVETNIGFLARLAACSAFAAADLDTGLIEREGEFLFPIGLEVPREAFLVATLALVLREEEQAAEHTRRHSDPHSPWHRRDSWRLNSNAERAIVYGVGGVEKTVGVRYAPPAYVFTLDGESTLARGELGARSSLRVDLDGLRLEAAVVVTGEALHVFLRGEVWKLTQVEGSGRKVAATGPDSGLFAPMPGTIMALVAREGAKVEKGAPLLILEAMKMEHTITAPSAGTVKAFCFAVGDRVGDGAALVEFEAA